MCRHLGYLGPPVTLSALLFDPPHALCRQAWAPRDMRGGGTVNVDGFGVGWFTGAVGPPRRYRRDRPIWSDPELPGFAADLAAPSVLAAVRSATTGMPVAEAACAPFAGDGWLFSLNGRVVGWPGTVAELAATLPTTDLLTMPAPTDAALLWTLLAYDLAAGTPPPEAVGGLVAKVRAVAPGSRLNLLLVGPRQMVATTVTHSLAVLRRPGAVLVSSEPLDDHPDWQQVPDDRLVTATADRVEISPLPAE